MSSWAGAQRLAHLVANRAHDDLGVARERYPVDVYGALDAPEVRIMWRPTPRLLGIYLCEPGAEKGVLLNRELTRAARRHTAAHELGHNRFGHGTHLDREIDEYLDSAPAAGWPKVEKEAETFAAWFLMPPPAVRAALARLGLRTADSAMQVYQLSLRLGTPYRTTARHLGNMRHITHQQAAQWSRVRPERLKASLDKHASPPGSRACDVWLVDPASRDEHLVLSPGDRVAVELAAGARADTVAGGVTGNRISVPPWMSVVADSAAVSGCRRVVLDTADQVTPAVARVDVDDRVPWSFTVELRPPPALGLDPLTSAAFERQARDAEHRSAGGDQAGDETPEQTRVEIPAEISGRRMT